MRLVLLMAVVAGLAASRFAGAAEYLMFVGTYTRGTQSEGIYAFRFDDATGAVAPLAVTGGVENPSFLALHPSGRFLYSSDEVDQFEGQHSGAVSAFAVDPARGALRLINRQPAGGTSPCHVCVDAAGRNVLAVGYGSGTVVAFPVAEDGSLQTASTLIVHKGASMHPQRQAAPHPHQIVLSPDNRFAHVPDLGLDRVMHYRFDAATGDLQRNQPPFAVTASGAGPRHLAFHPDGRRAYVINELDLTIAHFAYDPATGTLANRRTVAMMPSGGDTAGVTAAEIAVHPGGETLYASLRGRDEMVVFRIDRGTDELTFLQRISSGGRTPRFFALVPGGKWLLAANQNSGSIEVFRVGPDGRLEPAGVAIDVPSPVCLALLAR